MESHRSPFRRRGRLVEETPELQCKRGHSTARQEVSPSEAAVRRRMVVCVDGIHWSDRMHGEINRRNRGGSEIDCTKSDGESIHQWGRICNLRQSRSEKTSCGAQLSSAIEQRIPISTGSGICEVGHPEAGFDFRRLSVGGERCRESGFDLPREFGDESGVGGLLARFGQRVLVVVVEFASLDPLVPFGVAITGEVRSE